MFRLVWRWKGASRQNPLVGSQRSSDRGSSDATENLISAVLWAANGPQPGAVMGDAAVVVCTHRVMMEHARFSQERESESSTRPEEMRFVMSIASH